MITPVYKKEKLEMKKQATYSNNNDQIIWVTILALEFT